MKNRRFDDLPFSIMRPGGGRQLARFVCARCTAHAELPIVLVAGKMSPHDTLKRAEAAGWRLSGLRAECPSCQAVSAARAKGDRPGPKSLTPATAQVIQMADTKPRDPTPQERVKIRAILDAQFDDGAGCWLDGYSDQKAGEEVGVPWALVTKIREAAYGPIRVDPEIASLRAELVQIGRELAALMEKHGAAQKRMDALMSKRAAA